MRVLSSTPELWCLQGLPRPLRSGGGKPVQIRPAHPSEFREIVLVQVRVFIFVGRLVSMFLFGVLLASFCRFAALPPIPCGSANTRRWSLTDTETFLCALRFPRRELVNHPTVERSSVLNGYRGLWLLALPEDAMRLYTQRRSTTVMSRRSSSRPRYRVRKGGTVQVARLTSAVSAYNDHRMSRCSWQWCQRSGWVFYGWASSGDTRRWTGVCAVTTLGYGCMWPDVHQSGT